MEKRRIRYRSKEKEVLENYERNLGDIENDPKRCIAFIKGIALLDVALDARKQALFYNDLDTISNKVKDLQIEHFSSDDKISHYFVENVSDVLPLSRQDKESGKHRYNFPKINITSLHAYLAGKIRLSNSL